MLKTGVRGLALVAAILTWTLAAPAADPPAKAPDAVGGKIRLLILSGANNHAWRATTLVLQKMYDES